MPRPSARLANCYVPLHLETVTRKSREQKIRPPLSASRANRGNEELRQLCLETGVLSNQALGSSLVELGHTKILCQVSLNTSHQDAIQEAGVLDCKVKFAPHVGIDASIQRAHSVIPLESEVSVGKLNAEISSLEANLSVELSSALVSAIQLEKFPKCTIQLHATVLQDDGSVLSACITAATLALVDARVEMLDMVTSCTVAVLVPDPETTTSEEEEIEPIFLADPTEEEQMNATAIICLAMTPNLKEVSLWSQSGRLEATRANAAIELCRNGCRTMQKFMREVWLSD